MSSVHKVLGYSHDRSRSGGNVCIHIAVNGSWRNPGGYV